MLVRKTATRLASFAAAAGLSLALLLSASPASADAGFQRWIAGFRSTATQSGISKATFDRAFRNVRDVDAEVLEKARYQPEFTAPVWDYFDNRVHDQSVATGRAMARKWKPWLDRIEARFGVDRHILLAIWSMESNYGEILKNDQVMRNVVRSLATLAYADKRRAKFARTQLISALKILQSGDIDESHLMGSWAGAMGHTQFIPTSYQHYAVDMDGNGKRDIWNSIPDALATAANLLHKNGWQTGRTWGYEVTLPAGRKFPAGSLSLAKWQGLGLTRARSKPFPSSSDIAELKVPDGRQGPAFLVTKNFSVLKRYNNADKYALAVGLLADEIAGYGGLVRDWNRPFTKLSFEEKQELQQRLSAYGYYDGKFDGKIGQGSRAAIMAFQAKAGMEQDGHPSMEVLSVLRKR
ncbi:membrane-bound lytic murein transglycosylase B [Pseudaminobacter salicylatoxidans]|uniref:Membrane-bound lytic murein transglycosylase B n=1 Tax=Pseudaminobacter salicylatoxidans TaxID=93369 RepID=A0A316BLX1_PSESE|nr:lytic murein transglycosylase [Pseudaminobacter salicylatoxidans]PWJ73871.1 membrane-bound lytic murein transglycosylase B [Pseudaminobacter salicylatoxidans]